MLGGENYGPAHVNDMRGGVDSSGEIIAWDSEIWSLTKGGRPNATTPGNIISGALAGFPTPPFVPAAASPVKTFSNHGHAATPYVAVWVGSPCWGSGNVSSHRVLIHSVYSPLFARPLRPPDRLQTTIASS